MNSLEIIPATDGGFVVMNGQRLSEKAYYSPMLFAGSLPDCLEYMRGKLSAPAPSTDDVRRAS